jgi:hypothetical protein
MSSATLDRRIHRLESTLGSGDPRRYLGRPIDEWPDAALERVASMTDEEYAEFLKSNPHRSC